MDEPIRGLPPKAEFADAWTRFLGALKRLLVVTDERILGPYLSVRDTALTAAASPEVLAEFEKAWSKLHGPTAAAEKQANHIAHLLFMEIGAFPAAVELSAADEEAGKEPASLRKRLLGIGKTVIGSARDILDLSPLGKKILKGLGEIVEIFRGE